MDASLLPLLQNRAELCRLSYSGSDAALAAIIGNIDHFDSLDVDAHWCFYGSSSNPPQTWIVFRGSQSIEDFLSDFMVRPTPYDPFGFVHGGFAKEWTEFGKWLLAKEFVNGPIRITGHSAGGALATLCSASLQQLKFGPLDVVTFASPMVGDSAFAKFCPSQLRIVNDLDPIPLLPGKELGYVHVCPEIHLPTASWSAPWVAMRSIWRQARHGLGRLLIDAAADHHIDDYCEALG